MTRGESTAVVTSPRRRIVLMRHGAVDYFPEHGAPAAPDTVALSATGRAQADAAGALFAAEGTRFDLAITSDLPRTAQTAARVLATAGQQPRTEAVPALREIRGGPLSDIAPQQIEATFTGAFAAGTDLESRRFLGGESIGQMLDRVLPAFEALLARRDWQCLLLVLHGAVNRAILSRALTGGRAFLGSIEQSPACINLLDVGRRSIIVRSINLAPTQWLHEGERSTTMETLLAQYRRFRDAQPGTTPSPAA
jgi:probable phosphoglycerate mutase